LIVAAVLVPFLLWFVRSKTQKPGVEVVAQLLVGDDELHFSIVNTGRISFRTDEIFWKVYVDALNLPPRVLVMYAHTENIDGKTFWVYEKKLTDPLFSGISMGLFSIFLKSSYSGDPELRYVVLTPYGTFPKTATFDDKTRHPIIDTLGKVEVIRVED